MAPRSTKRDKVYSKIREDILHGILRPGERIVESKLCEAYSIGRTPLRTIIMQLEKEGLVTVIPNRGATVSKLSIEEIDQIYRVRAVLEGYAARCSCSQISETQIAWLEKVQQALTKAAANLDYLDWLSNNSDFHSFFSKESNNAHLLRITEELRGRVFRYHYLSITIPGHFDEYLRQHEKIIAHIKNQKPSLAEKAMVEHLETVRSILLDYLRQFPGF